MNGSRVFCGYLRKFIDKPRDDELRSPFVLGLRLSLSSIRFTEELKIGLEEVLKALLPNSFSVHVDE